MYKKQIFFTFLLVSVWLFTIFPFVYGQDTERAKILYHQALGEKDLAQRIMLYKQAIKENGQFTEAFVNLGDTYEKLGQLDNAIRYYSKGVETNPEFPMAYFGLGDVYLATGQYSRAIESYEKGLRFRPHDGLALAGRAIAKQRLRAYRQINRERIINKKKITEYLINPLAGIKPQAITKAARDIKVKIRPRIGIHIYFEYKKWHLSLEAKQQLDSVAQALQSESLHDVPITIEGHTDDVGSEKYNLDLSFKRGYSVQRYLCTMYGFKSDRFTVKGFGESRPVDSQTTEQARTRNRRVEFVRGKP